MSCPVSAIGRTGAHVMSVYHEIVLQASHICLCPCGCMQANPSIPAGLILLPLYSPVRQYAGCDATSGYDARDSTSHALYAVDGESRSVEADIISLSTLAV